MVFTARNLYTNAAMSRRDRVLETSPIIYCEDNSLNIHRRHSGKCKNSNQRSSEGATPPCIYVRRVTPSGQM